jgi:hypothetical protein
MEDKKIQKLNSEIAFILKYVFSGPTAQFSFEVLSFVEWRVKSSPDGKTADRSTTTRHESCIGSFQVLFEETSSIY